LGENGFVRDVPKALELASVCGHPDAVWLSSLFVGRNVNTEEEAKEVFVEHANDTDDLRARFFATVITVEEDEHPIDVDVLREIACLGSAPAMSWMAAWSSGKDKFDWAIKAAVRGERDAFFWLAGCFEIGEGCVPDPAKERENYLIAARLGSVLSMCFYGELFKKTDPERYVWLAKAAMRGVGEEIFSDIVEQVQDFERGQGHANVVFAIGRAVKGCVNVEEIFGLSEPSDPQVIDCATRSVDFFEYQLKQYRKAVDTWTIIARRCGVVKDMRKLIGGLIWNAREEAEYAMDENIQPASAKRQRTTLEQEWKENNYKV
jgi:hypothetical protein